MTWISFTRVSGNKKLGPIGVSTSDDQSCPNYCSLKDTDCYARFGPLSIHWRKVSNRLRGDNWNGFCKRIAKLKRGFLWRHNQAGDLSPNKNGTINRRRLNQLVRASTRSNGFTYTHYDPTNQHNADAIRHANDNGFTINLSADNANHADNYVDLDIGPVVCILPIGSDQYRSHSTPNGRPIVICPAQINDDINCSQCRLCSHADRKSIVGFIAHGTAKKRLSKKLEFENKG